MGSNYDYSYEYDVTDPHRHNRAARDNGGRHTQRATGNQSHYVVPHSTFGRASGSMDPLVNLQHDRIWHKLYDPLEADKSSVEAEAQKMARRQDRKVIKIEAAYGSDRQTLIVKRNYDLRVCDLQEDASKIFRMPADHIVLYWKGRNICDTPNELLETLGIENNHQMRVCRADDPAQQTRRREMRTYATSDQQYSSSNDMYQQQRFQSQSRQQPQQYMSQPSMNDQQSFGNTSRTNYYQQLTSPSGNPPVAPTSVVNLQIGCGDRTEGLAIGRPHPITIYDLQVELQQRFNIPILDQCITHNKIPLTQYPPDAPLESLGIGNNTLLTLWHRNQGPAYQQQLPPSACADGYQMPRGNAQNDASPRRMDNVNSNNDEMQNAASQEVVKIEVFHGSDRHVLVLHSTNNLRIIDLMEELQRITTVPVPRQKLYFRGQELQTMKERTLHDAGVDNNAQVRLIGDPTRQRYEAMITGNRTN